MVIQSSLEDLPQSLDGSLFVSGFVHEDGQLDPLRLGPSDGNTWLALHQQTFHLASRDPEDLFVPLDLHATDFAGPVDRRALQLQAWHCREFPFEILGLFDALAIDGVEVKP